LTCAAVLKILEASASVGRADVIVLRMEGERLG
jgi:hypothetical protein